MNDALNGRRLFRVERVAVPEWGRSRVEFARYYVAASRDTVKAVVENRFGTAKYYCYDRESVEYQIEDCGEVEFL